jgi:hypothetical protein
LCRHWLHIVHNSKGNLTSIRPHLYFLTIHQIHYHVLLISTAFVGASALMLGIDCFTTAGVKEV